MEYQHTSIFSFLLLNHLGKKQRVTVKMLKALTVTEIVGYTFKEEQDILRFC